ncbi:MAG: heme exporter protein CcmB [Thermoanaerobaculaceae bacterium]
MRSLSLLSESLTVLHKELVSERRSRVAISSVGLFALTTLVAVAYQIGPYRIQEQDRPHLHSALLWIILFFAASSGLSRVFVKEEDAHTAKSLRLAARAGAVFIGKFLFNFFLLLGLEAFLVPLYGVFMGFSVANLWALLLALGAGALGLAATSTTVAAIIARASGSSTLFVVLAVPLVLPMLVFLIQGTRMAVVSSDWSAVIPALRAVLSLTGVTLLTSAFLFPVVWHD